MNLSAPFVRRPVATTLLTFALTLAGAFAALRMPAAALPEAELPVIMVIAQMPGASPEVMAATVATPLERRLAAIADVTEISSANNRGKTQISVSFGLGRDLDGAALEVQGAISAARADLPAALVGSPTIFRTNATLAPIAFLSLTSDTLAPGKLFDLATMNVQPLLASIRGVGDVSVLGSAPSAIRIELDLDALTKYGVDIESARAALAAASANSPKGVIESHGRRLQIYANDSANTVEELRDVVIAYRENAPIRISDVAEVVESVEKAQPFAMTDSLRSILLRIRKAPGSNLVETTDRIRARLDQIRAALPPGVEARLVSDRTGTIRASLAELELGLLSSCALVILVVFVFLRDWRAALIAAVAAPVSLLGAAVVMHAQGYSLNNISLMALIVATGLVVDDSIIVVENIARHRSAGKQQTEAVLLGVGEVGFTVVAVSLSVIAVFMPLLFVGGGIIGRIAGEFAVSLAAAIATSLLISLTATPMLCAVIGEGRPWRPLPRGPRAFDDRGGPFEQFYQWTLDVALRRSTVAMSSLVALFVCNLYLYVTIPKGVLPKSDVPRLRGLLAAEEGASSAALREKLRRAAKIIGEDPSVTGLAAYVSESIDANEAEVAINLLPISKRGESADAVAQRLTDEVSRIPGATFKAKPAQEMGDSSRADRGWRHQYDLRGDDMDELRYWAFRLVAALAREPKVQDPFLTKDGHGVEAHLFIDRDRATSLGVTVTQIDNTLFDAYGQRRVSTFRDSAGSHYILMEADRSHREDASALGRLYVGSTGGPARGTQLTNAPAGTVVSEAGQSSSDDKNVVADAARNQRVNAIANRTGGVAPTSAAVSTGAATMIPLSAISHAEFQPSAYYFEHIGNSAAASITFDLAPGVPLEKAMEAIEMVKAEIHMPASIHSGFSGLAATIQSLIVKEIVLIFATIVTIYIILGILYESFAHPLTILSTLPSAGAGALATLRVLDVELTLIAFIGIILLTGIVMKNAIMMIDVAVRSIREEALSAEEAVRRACATRFRPIMMTTIAGIVGSLPLAIGFGEGAEFRQPLGFAIIGGLVVSQALTLYTTPVIFLAVEKLRDRALHRRSSASIS